MNVTKFKKPLLLAVVYLAVLGIYNILVFNIFKNPNEVFWVSYVFMTLAVLVNVGVTMLTFFKEKDIETVFFGIPLLSFSVFYVFAELFVSVVFMIFRNSLGLTLPLIVQSILLLVFIIISAIALLSKDVVQGVENTVKTNSANIKMLSVDVQVLENQCLDSELKQQLHKVAEGIKYSDPMTNAAVAQLDEMIRGKVNELKYLCQNNQKNEAMQVCFQLQSYISERNSKLILTK